jgi:hypothetical protein
VKIQEDYYASVNIQGYSCLPANVNDKPLQYVVSFDPPLMVTNYNFRPLEVRNATNKDLLTLMGPKETSIINDIDTIGSKPSI